LATEVSRIKCVSRSRRLNSAMGNKELEVGKPQKPIDLKRKPGYFIKRKWAGSGEPPGLQIQ